MANYIQLGNSKKRVTTHDLKSLGIKSYDWDNIYPQRVSRTGQRSSTDLAARQLFTAHLIGRGFKEEFLNKIKVNGKNQTLAQVHKMLAQDFAQFNGCALHINYNALFQITEIRHVSFQDVRLCLPGDDGIIKKVAVYDNWASDDNKRLDASKIKRLDIYSEDLAVTMGQCAIAGGVDSWEGQILYFTDNSILEYPLATCDAAFEEVETDHLISSLKWKWVKNGFFPGAMITHIGKPEGLTKDAHGNEDVSWQDDVIRATTENQGAEKAHNVINVFAQSLEQAPKIDQFEIKDAYKSFEATEGSVIKSIIRNYGQPRILHGIDQPGSLGLSKEWEEGKKNYDERTLEKRKSLALIFLPILNNWHETLAITDEQLLVVPVTGFETKKENRTLAEQIGVGGLQSVQAIVESTVMTPAQKINYMVAVFGINIETASAIVTGTPLPTL